jgi:wyosine [tRNA(Phe)-imidazoG37] synthetase (radical SAM superfamily)
MADMAFRYVFGPVASRRLGRSLGVDVVPFKTCTYDCIYCQLGPTTRRTVERGDYVPLEGVLEELRRTLAAGVAADYITIAGSGEPTLYSGLKRLITGIKAMTDIPVAVITNGALLWMPEVQEDLLDADLVVPSLDAGTEASFARVNRPCTGLGFDRMVEGLVAFRRRYRGRLWLEVFLLGGITDTDAEVARIADAVERIRPDKIQLNTVARPAPGSDVAPVPPDVMERIARRFGPNAEVIAHYELSRHATRAEIRPEDVLAVVQRHPCSLADIAQGLGISLDEAAEHMAALTEKRAVSEEIRDGIPFYLANNTERDR